MIKEYHLHNACTLENRQRGILINNIIFVYTNLEMEGELYVRKIKDLHIIGLLSTLRN